MAERALNYDARDVESAAFGRFAIMDAGRVVSLQHIAVAGNIALARSARWEAHAQAQAQAQGSFEQGGGGANSNNRRGIGQETVICSAGTSHAGYALRDYGFFDVASASETEKKQKEKQQDAMAKASSFTILAIGFDCKDDAEYDKFLADMNLADGQPNMGQYFGRPRSKQELAGLLKSFKVSQNEVDMHGSSLEHAIITRIATKFV
eukprot:CAMPEP_0197727114 /NCGR_PEP_ID=MMETSP1434-20131217/18519_1 /TAXON_ID=265543 /ORGANISM="Minutocellus polymorphus, Strain CCMP3303" /LENGTH=206 /DNA_ID=CAMNT_0043313219 /DNA_START=167 /DNA_END=784 /DNA_ORIENTATION=+